LLLLQEIWSLCQRLPKEEWRLLLLQKARAWRGQLLGDEGQTRRKKGRTQCKEIK
jgi:hypothetical protein